MLLRSHVPKNIDRKTMLFGLELFDCFAVLTLFAVLNFIFNGSIISWIAPAILALVLYFGKRGKPEGYLLHYLQYLTAPKVFSASEPDFEFRPYFTGE